MINWTKSQAAAIERTAGRVYVSAAAGSGKTAVLVERIVGIIADQEHQIPADRLLVVTFTRAAASEMRARIKKRIDEMLRARPKDGYLRRQALLLRRANISTVHAFCMSLLREFWMELGIPPDVTVAGDLFLDDMRETALRRASERLYADEDGRFRAFSDLFGRARSDAEALAMIDGIDRFLDDLVDPKGWRDVTVAGLRSGAPVRETAAGKLLFDMAGEAAASAIGLLRRGIETIEKDEQLSAGYGEAFLGDLRFLEELSERIERGEWDQCRRALGGFSPMRLSPARGADETLKNDAQHCRRSARNIVEKVLKTRYFSVSEEDFYKDGRRVAEAMEILFDAVGVFREELTAIKKKRRMVDYGDLERMAIELLSGDCLAREEVLSRFDYLLVDEYQDTNEVQDRLFSLLTEKSGNFFAVGDIKQSIYSFRRADPEIFLEKRRGAVHYKEADEGERNIHIPLTHNFRSNTAVIDAVNAVFRRVMTERLGGVDYAGGEELTTESDGERQSGAGIEICIAESLGTRETAEAKEIARMIKSMLNEGCPVWERRGGESVSRRCRPGDFAILLRARRKAALFAEQLAGEGIPVNSDGGGTFFENSEIAVLLSLLRVIDNPKRDVEMAAVLLSPLFSFSPDDLLRLKEHDRHRDLYSAMLESRDEKVIQFVGRLREWRLRAAGEPVEILLQDVVDETDAELLLTAGNVFFERRRNIRLLIENAVTLSSAGGLSLSRFLLLMERRKKQNDPLSGGFSPSKDAVNILTIHKSKGLEWPFVIIADAAHGFNYTDSRQPPMLFDRDYGAGLRYRAESGDLGSPLVIRATAQYRAVAAAKERKTIGEEVRVLYVALTRAKQKVFVTAAGDAEKLIPGSFDEYALSSAQNYLTWLLSAAGEEHEKLVSAAVSKDGYDNGVIRLRIIKQEETELRPDAPPDDGVAFPGEAIEILRERVNYRYPYAARTSVPAKISVSELVKNGDPPVRVPSFMSADGLGPAARGTAVHQFMQYADYRAASRSVKGELLRLKEGGYLLQEYADAVDIQKIERFFESDLARRMLSGETLREYAFLDAVNASEITGISGELTGEKVVVQGIADCIIIEDGGAVLIDYKSDRVKTEEQLTERYRPQLALYKRALEKRLGIPIKESYIYSFALGKAIRL